MAAPKNEDPTPVITPEQITQPLTFKMIKYVGRGSEKILTQKDFNDSGIKGQKGVRWHNLNGYMVSVDDFSEEALAFVLSQPTVELVEVDADGTQV